MWPASHFTPGLVEDAESWRMWRFFDVGAVVESLIDDAVAVASEDGTARKVSRAHARGTQSEVHPRRVAVGVDWAVHIPKLIDYWCQVLLGEPGYNGYILGPHRAVHDLRPFDAELFDRWYLLWVDSIDARWAGAFAERAKTHAARIARVLSRKLADHEWSVPPSTVAVSRSGTTI